jgi:hypothetical protein
MPPKSHAEMITATVKKSPIVRQVAVCSHEHTFVAPCRALEGLMLHQIPRSYLGVWLPVLKVNLATFSPDFPVHSLQDR